MKHSYWFKMKLSDWFKMRRDFENPKKHSDRGDQWKDMCWSETQKP